MEPFRKHRGLVATLDRANVDTDQIVPKQFLKRIERTGFGPCAFHDWRYLPDGSLNPAFELNRPEFAGASILVTRANFGCGSSREHAVWALADYGFRVLISPKFADIFLNNCFKNGLLAIQLKEPQVQTLFDRAKQHKGYMLTVDLERCSVSDEFGLQMQFELDAARRKCLLEGLDEIALTLQHEEEILAYERARGIVS